VSLDSDILDVAERLFVAHGYAGVGVDAIAAAAGCNASAIYRCFSGKRALLAALFDRANDEIRTRLGPALDDPVEELGHLIDVHASFARECPNLAVIMAQEGSELSSADQQVFEGRYRPYLDRWDAALAARYPGGRRDDLVTARDAVHWLLASPAVSRVRSPRPKADTILRSMAFAALAGLTATGP
jgi:AcrR family transcriptional regulator